MHSKFPTFWIAQTPQRRLELKITNMYVLANNWRPTLLLPFFRPIFAAQLHSSQFGAKKPKFPALKWKQNQQQQSAEYITSPIAFSREKEMGGGGGEVQYWLLKTEAGEWSWEDQAANGGISHWDGVKNKQAQKYMKSMKVGDLCFFYHSGAKARRIVGVVSVTKEWHSSKEEEDDGKGGGAVDVEAVGEMNRPVDLKEMKGDDGLKGFSLFKQPRLSVVPVPKKIWDRVCEIGGGFGDESEPTED